MTWAIRTIGPRDVEPILAIQSECPEIAQWTMWDYDRVARGEMAGWVAEEDAEVVGFLVARRVLTDLEILNFAIKHGSRRRGVGTWLLREALAWSQSFFADKAILEVRESNVAALRFYEERHFEVSGRRKNYYTAPIEDALLLTAPLT
jgi:ribosomal-protein-alanine N-acetyltransferase